MLHISSVVRVLYGVLGFESQFDILLVAQQAPVTGLHTAKGVKFSFPAWF